MNDLIPVKFDNASSTLPSWVVTPNSTSLILD